MRIHLLYGIGIVLKKIRTKLFIKRTATIEDLRSRIDSNQTIREHLKIAKTT
jgi:hypothetical protein